MDISINFLVVDMSKEIKYGGNLFDNQFGYYKFC